MTFGDPLWAAATIETLKDGAARGLSASKIAALINATHGITATRNAVIGKLTRLGVKLKGRAHRPARISSAPATVSRARAQPSPPRPLNCRAPAHEPEVTPVHNGQTHTLLSLPRGVCKWPVYGSGRLTLFCGQPATAAPYCEDHAARGWVKPPADTRQSEPPASSNSPRGGAAAPASPQRAGSGGHGSASPAMAAAPPDGGIILNRKTLAEVERDAAEAMRAGRRDIVKRAASPRKPKAMVGAGLICRESFRRGPCASICRECAEFQMPQPKNGARHAGR